MDYYIKNVSYSQVGQLMKDSGKWGEGYLLGRWDNTTGVAAAAGTIAHKFVEHLIRTDGDETKALKRAYDCIYTIKGNTFIIDPDEFDKPLKEMSEDVILENFKTKKLDFKKSSMEVLLKKVKGAIDGYLSEKIHYGDILGVEKKMEYEITDKILDKTFTLPVPVKAIADQVCQTKEVLQMVNGDKEVMTIPIGSIYIEDVKFSDKFKELNIDSGSFFFQSMFLYYTTKREYGVAPTHINFRVVKNSKNRDGSSQQQVVTFFFLGEDFEIAKTDFWRYMLRWFELVEFYQNGDIIYNCFDFIDGDKAWAKQRAYYRDISVENLKQTISVSNRSKENGNNFTGHKFNLMEKGKEIKEENTVVGEIEVEDIIRTKLLEFGLPIQYEKTNEGYAYNQILFTPGRGVEMRKLEQKLKELQQATGFEGIRIEAPVPGTKFIGIEYPRTDRKYLEFSKYKQKKRCLKIPIGNDLSGNTVEVDLTSSNYPHLLVAGTTGSGKSEWLKVAIESLLGKCDLILIDPKMVEFADYESRASAYLVWEGEVLENLYALEKDMKYRYNLMKQSGVKDIEDYNKKVKKKLKRFVVIIDEFGDLKLSSEGPNIERCIERITALGRAAGIHIILATQRPDTKIINGRIRNNIATRICLKVGSSIDSSVILEKTGAETLLGKGDLIFKDGTKRTRLQSFYIPEEE